MQQEVHPDIFEDVQFPEDVVGETQQADQSWQAGLWLTFPKELFWADLWCPLAEQLGLGRLQALRAAWTAFIMGSKSKEAAGGELREALYAAIFDAAPSMQDLFRSPRRVRDGYEIHERPGSLTFAQGEVETLGFQHLDLEVTVPRVGIFVEAIEGLLEMELNRGFSANARHGLAAILNYIGGAFIFIRREYSGRINLLLSSWTDATRKALVDVDTAKQEDGLEEDVEEGEDVKKSLQEIDSAKRDQTAQGIQVPGSFNEMFLFNAAVMGFGASQWMKPILVQLDVMVMNVANSYRLQEECDVLSLLLSRYQGSILLSEFRAVVLASLRSLVPKGWDSEHEVAWNWFWENVERMLKANLSKKLQGKAAALEKLLSSLQPEEFLELRRGIYRKFFELAPAGQDFFKQSTARLYFIADKVIEMTVDMYHRPREMVENISALGLRHVGYAIPIELFAPFVSATVEVLRGLTTDDTAEEAFRWSLTLIGKILVRTTMEGSTIVMKAVNTNQEKALRRAIASVPRGLRAMELLNVAVGTQSISPLYWAIESGSLNVAKAMVIDLLTIRADRDNYYYGYDALFTRHPDIIRKLSIDAPDLQWPLLDGLIWRSRLTKEGVRRVNFYIKHLVQDAEGNLNQALEWLADAADPKVISHSVVVLFADLLWERLIIYQFLTGRLYFLFTLIIFVISQIQPIVMDLRAGAVRRIYHVPVPESLCSLQEAGYLVLIFGLIIMCIEEPIFRCLGSSEEYGLFSSDCPQAAGHKEVYSVVAGLNTFLYWVLITDLSILSMRISAFVLVCLRVMAELGLFLLALCFLIFAFATSISTLKHGIPDFAGIGLAGMSLLSICLGIFPAEKFYDIEESIWVMLVVCSFLVLVGAFLLRPDKFARLEKLSLRQRIGQVRCNDFPRILSAVSARVRALQLRILRVARPKGTPRARKSYASNAPSQGASGAESSDGSSSSEEESDDCFPEELKRRCSIAGETEQVEHEDEEGEVPEEGVEGAKVEEVVDLGASVEKYQAVQEMVFEELHLPPEIAAEAQSVWQLFINTSSSREAAGEAIYAALFDAAPSLQSLFKTARSVMALRFMNGINNIICVANNPMALKLQVETLGFQHLDLEVTAPRVDIFREAILELLEIELGPRMTSKGRVGLQVVLNYVGGAYIYIRREYAGRIRIIQKSWLTANNKVPTSFNEMFLFNAAVMGFGESGWMNLVLEQFDNIVTNVANSYRLQEECDVLSLVLSQYVGQITLPEFKAVMLASLRSLVPKEWDSNHEVAWNWLWENVERMLKSNIGKPQVHVKAIERLIMDLTEDSVNYLRREIYKRFFQLAPAGQDYFKQSTTRLFFIADKIIELTVEMYKQPKTMVEDLSAMGLRHVGYAIPTELFSPFVSGAVDVVRTLTTDEHAESAFRWSLTLVAKILVRTILEGSTVVMKAVNTNSEKAMLQDLLTIRADRDNYYYGCDALFSRHPEVIHRLCADAPTLLTTLLDGLIWRSRLTSAGMRRVNFYVKHLVQDKDEYFNQALSWLAEFKDPKIVSHPVVVLFADMIWGRLAMYHFMLGRCYFLLMLCLFVTSQAIIPRMQVGGKGTAEQNIALFTCRCLIYLGSMCLCSQLRLLYLDIKAGAFQRTCYIPLPSYIFSFQEAGNLALLVTLIVMCSQEPIFYCIGTPEFQPGA
ncbi:unnamed protein product [Effrenium voratum]|nr:unnamed protein product [Effrenium voratum]